LWGDQKRRRNAVVSEVEREFGGWEKKRKKKITRGKGEAAWGMVEVKRAKRGERGGVAGKLRRLGTVKRPGSRPEA